MAQTLEEFLVNVRYNIDQPSQQRFFDAMKRAATSVSVLSGAMTGLGIEILRVTDKMATAGEKLYWMSQRVGDSVSDIQGMAFAMSNLGVSSDQAVSGIERFGAWTRSMGPAATGYLRSLGITATDTVGRMKQLGEYFRSGGGTQAQQGTLEYALMLRRASMMGIDENTMLALSSGRMEQNLAQAGLMQRLVWGKDWQAGPQKFASQSNLVMNQFRQMGFFFQNLSQQFGLGLFNAILPDLTKINELLIRMLPDIRVFLDHIISYAPLALHFLEGVMQAFGFMLELASFAMKEFEKIPHSIDLMIGGMLGLGSMLKLAASPLFLLMAGFTAFLVLLDDYQHYMDDLKHPGEKPTHGLPWDKIGAFFKPFQEGIKDIDHWAEKMFGVKDAVEWLAGSAGIIALAAAFTPLIAAAAFLAGIFWGPAGIVLGVIAAAGGMRLAGMEERQLANEAKNAGYTASYDSEGGWLFKGPNGETLDSEQMAKRLGHQQGYVTPWELDPRHLGEGYGPPTAEEDRAAHPPLTVPPRGTGTVTPKPPPIDLGISRWLRERMHRLGQPWAPLPGDQHSSLGSDGRYQTASLDWMGPPGGRRDEFYTPDRFFVLLRDNGEAVIEKLSDILDTLSDMAEGQGAPRTARGGSGSTTPMGVPGDQAQTAQNLMKMVMEEWGVDQEHAAPIVSAMLRESSGHADISYGGGPLTEEGRQAIGLFQLTGPRHVAFIEWARRNGLNPRDPRVQVQYGKIEADRDYPGWKAATESTNLEAFGDLFEAGGVHGGYPHGNYTDFLRHMPLSGGVVGGGGGGRGPDYNSGPSIVQHNSTQISMVAPNPASGAMQVAERQQSVFEHHIRYAKGRLLA